MCRCPSVFNRSRMSTTDPTRTIKGWPSRPSASCNSTSVSAMNAQCRCDASACCQRFDNVERQDRAGLCSTRQGQMIVCPQISLEPDDLQTHTDIASQCRSWTSGQRVPQDTENLGAGCEMAMWLFCRMPSLSRSARPQSRRGVDMSCTSSDAMHLAVANPFSFSKENGTGCVHMRSEILRHRPAHIRVIMQAARSGARPPRS